VVGDRIGLQEGEKRLLDGEVPAVAWSVDVGVSNDLPGLEFGVQEASAVGWQRRVRDCMEETKLAKSNSRGGAPV